MIPFYILLAVAFGGGLIADESPGQVEKTEAIHTKKSTFTFFGYHSLITEAEKELSQLHSNAESAMQRKEYIPANSAYEEIIKKIDPPFISTGKFKVDWSTYIDLVLRLSEAKLYLKDLEQGEKLLLNLEKTNPPKEYLPSIYFLKARYCATCSNPAKAYITMSQALAYLPIEKWRGEERSFFHSLEYLLNDYFDDLLKKAKRFSYAGQNEKAIKMYEEIHRAIEDKIYPRALTEPLLEKKVKVHIAELHYAEAAYSKALAAVETSSPHGGNAIDSEMIYLSACAFSEKKEYEKVISECEKYTKKRGLDNDHLIHAHLELGLNQFKHQAFPQAKGSFLKVREKTGHGKSHSMAVFHLAQIAFQEGNDEEALSYLNEIGKDKDFFPFEILSLKGEIAFARKDYTSAIEYFEKASALNSEKKLFLLYHLATAYLQFNSSQSKGEKMLMDLILAGPHEKYLLTLAEFYFKIGDTEKITSLYEKYKTHLTRNGEGTFLLLQARLNTNRKLKKELFNQVTSARFENTDSYHHALYHHALWCIREGSFKDPTHYFEKSLDCLSPPICLQGDDIEALKEIEVYLASSSFKASSGAHYLHGLIAATLAKVEQGDLKNKYVSTAISLLQEISTMSKWHGKALFALGTLYFRCERYHEAFTIMERIATSHHDSPLAAHALFWQAECLEKLGESKAKELRKRCYEMYPFSSIAPVAHFKVFPFENYLQGDQAAIDHLKGFSLSLPHSPLTLLAYYFTGIHEKDSALSLQLLERSCHFDTAKFERETEYNKSAIYYQKKAIHAYVERVLEDHLPLDFSISLLQRSLNETGASMSSLKFEGELLLARCYIQNNQDKKAEEILLRMLDVFRQSSIFEGAHVSKVLQQLGVLATKNEDDLTSRTCFKMAST